MVGNTRGIRGGIKQWVCRIILDGGLSILGMLVMFLIPKIDWGNVPVNVHIVKSAVHIQQQEKHI